MSGLWLSTILNIISSPSISLMKSVMYFPLIPKLTGSPSTMAAIDVFQAPLSVFPEVMIILSFCVSIWMKLFMSLVRIPIFLIAFSHSDLSTMTVVLNVDGIISSLA